MNDMTTVAIPKELLTRIKNHGKLGNKCWEVIDKMEKNYKR